MNSLNTNHYTIINKEVFRQTARGGQGQMCPTSAFQKHIKNDQNDELKIDCVKENHECFSFKSNKQKLKNLQKTKKNHLK